MNTTIGKADTPNRYSFGPFMLDIVNGILSRRDEANHEEILDLTPTSFEILTLLVSRAGDVLTHDEIMDHIWGPEEVKDDNIPTRITEIRRCLGDDSKNPIYIRTIRNRHAYRFEKDQVVVIGATEKAPPESVSSHFSKLDTIHVHVDGGSEEALVTDIVLRFQREGKQSKINSVVDFTTGPQRKDCPEDYIPHTPGGIDSEHLEFFSTHVFGNFAETKRDMRHLLSRLLDTGHSGMVVEAERIIGKFSDDRGMEWSDFYIHHHPVLCSGDVGYEGSKTKPIEIHYAIDIPREGQWLDDPPLDLEVLPRFTADLGIRVGGWFLFDEREENKWAYRSNMLVKAAQRDEIEKYRRRLKAAMEELGRRKGFTCEVRALVEQIIGIWNTPLKSFSGPISVEELSNWEATYPALRDFWVVTPNFLGDKEKPIQDAMISNLQNRNVTYTYFLRSVADYNRLLSLAEDLERKLGGHVPVFERIRAVLVIRDASRVSLLERVFEQGAGQGCFIANPLPQDGQGDDADGYYMIEKSEIPGQISGGRVMKREQVKEIVELLKPLVPDGRHLQGFSLPLRPHKNKELHGVTMICIGLKNLSQLLNDVDERSTAQLLRNYDLMIATETSKLGGQVMRSIEPGYLLMFEKQNAALVCAGQVQKGIEVIGGDFQQRIAIDFGDVWQVMRAHGLDYCGKTIARCRELLKKTRYGEVWMTDSFANEVGNRYASKLVESTQEFVFDKRRIKIWKLIL